MTHASFYLQQSIFEQDIIYQNEAFNNKNRIISDCGFKKENEYISELELMCKPTLLEFYDCILWISVSII
jgi:hypothetical protein